jgi:hypothetical protein
MQMQAQAWAPCTPVYTGLMQILKENVCLHACMHENCCLHCMHEIPVLSLQPGLVPTLSEMSDCTFLSCLPLGLEIPFSMWMTVAASKAYLQLLPSNTYSISSTWRVVTASSKSPQNHTTGTLDVQFPPLVLHPTELFTSFCKCAGAKAKAQNGALAPPDADSEALNVLPTEEELLTCDCPFCVAYRGRSGTVRSTGTGPPACPGKAPVTGAVAGAKPAPALITAPLKDPLAQGFKATAVIGISCKVCTTFCGSVCYYSGSCLWSLLLICIGSTADSNTAPISLSLAYLARYVSPSVAASVSIVASCCGLLTLIFIRSTAGY